MSELARPVSADEVRAKAQEVVAAANKAMTGILAYSDFGDKVREEQIDVIPAWFEAFNFGEPEKLDGMLSCVDLAAGDLDQPEMLDSQLMSQWMSQWNGNAADKFHEFFLAPFPQIASNHLSAIAALNAGITASQQIMYSTRLSALEIGDQTIAALKQIKKKKTSVWGKILPIVAIVATVAAGLTPIGLAGRVAATAAAKVASQKVAGLALGFTLLGQGNLIYQTAKGWDGVSGGSVPTILKSMFASLDKLAGQVRAEAEDLNKALAADIGKLSAKAMLVDSADVLVEAASNHDLSGFYQAKIDN